MESLDRPHKNMIEELSLVRLIRPISSPAIPVGSVGTILMVHDSSPPAYEVEFTDANGKTLVDPHSELFVFTVSESDLEIWPEKLNA